MADNHVETALKLLNKTLNETKGLDRRQFVKRLGAVSASSALLASFYGMFSERALADVKPVTTMGWGGPWKDAMTTCYSDPFTKASGIPVDFISPYDYSKIKLMDQAHQQQVDLIEPAALDTLRAIRDDLTIPLDFNIIDKSKLSPGQLTLKNAVGGSSIATVMVYSKERWPGATHPDSWADFFDLQKYPGPRCLERLPYPTLEFALLADGVPKEKLYPLDLDRAFKKLDQIKSNVIMWFSTGSEPQQMIQNKEIDLTSMWTSRANDSIINKKAPYEIVWNDAASTGAYESWLVLRNSPNPEAAMKYINFAASAEAQAAFARLMFCAPTNLKAYDLLDEEIAQSLPTYPANEEKMFAINFDYWLDNLDQVTLRFENWLQS